MGDCLFPLVNIWDIATDYVDGEDQKGVSIDGRRAVVRIWGGAEKLGRVYAPTTHKGQLTLPPI
jgi:hypothetical protein